MISSMSDCFQRKVRATNRVVLVGAGIALFFHTDRRWPGVAALCGRRDHTHEHLEAQGNRNVPGFAAGVRTAGRHDLSGILRIHAQPKGTAPMKVERPPHDRCLSHAEHI